MSRVGHDSDGENAASIGVACEVGDESSLSFYNNVQTGFRRVRGALAGLTGASPDRSSVVWHTVRSVAVVLSLGVRCGRGEIAVRWCRLGRMARVARPGLRGRC